MNMLTFIAVSDLKRSVAFYEALGFGPVVEVTDTIRQLALGDAGVMLSTEREGVPPASDRVQIGLNMGPDEGFDAYRERCRSRGLEVSEIVQEWFGRIFWVHDPDGVTVQINEIG